MSKNKGGKRKILKNISNPAIGVQKFEKAQS